MILNNMILAALPALLLTVSLAAQAPPSDAPLARVERRLGLMGTGLALVVEAPDRPTALAASEAAVRALLAAEQRLSTWIPDSEMSLLNAAPAGVWHAVSPALWADLEAALRWSRDTGGAFQPVIRPLVDAWGLRSGGRRPSAVELERARLLCQPDGVEFGDQGLRLLRPGAGFEEGGFGKGRGLDLALAALAETGASSAELDLGGQLAWLGDAPVEVVIAHPRRRDQAAAHLLLEGGSLATSGNSERGILVDGQRLGHLLDPRSGLPAADFGSLSVWAPDATAADCLSTGLYALGADAALAWAEAHPGIEVLVLQTDDQDRVVARFSSGLRSRIRLPKQDH